MSINYASFSNTQPFIWCRIMSTGWCMTRKITIGHMGSSIRLQNFHQLATGFNDDWTKVCHRLDFKIKYLSGTYCLAANRYPSFLIKSSREIEPFNSSASASRTACDSDFLKIAVIPRAFTYVSFCNLTRTSIKT